MPAHAGAVLEGEVVEGFSRDPPPPPPPPRPPVTQNVIFMRKFG